MPAPSLHGQEKSSFVHCASSGYTVDSESVVGIKPDDFGMVVEYQVDEFTHTDQWSILLLCTSLQGSYGGVITDSEVHELLTKILDILDSTVPKWVGNSSCILAYLFKSAFQTVS